MSKTLKASQEKCMIAANHVVHDFVQKSGFAKVVYTKVSKLLKASFKK